MPRTLQARAAARGYPVIDISGQSGVGALPDSTLPSGQITGQPDTSGWTDPNNDPASVPATLPAPEPYVQLGHMAWGLPGAPNPDDTPRTHAAPIADKTLPIAEQNAELEATHAPEFSGVQIRRHPGTNPRMKFGQQLVQGNGTTNLQPLAGQIRSNAGYDAVQGYGGGGDGPGGTNRTMPLTTLDRQFPGPQGQVTYVSAGEVPLIVPAADQFIASAPELPAYAPSFDAPTTSVQAQDVTTGDIPATGPALSAPAGLLPLWGSLNG